MSPAPAPNSGSKPRPTSEQASARWAWDQVKSGVRPEYASLVKAVPSLIMTSGLIQTLAYLDDKAKGEDEHKAIAWAIGERLGLGRGVKAAIDRLMELDASAYRAKTEEAMGLLRWLRHLAAVSAKAGENKTRDGGARSAGAGAR